MSAATTVERNIDLIRTAFKAFDSAPIETCAAMLTPDFTINLAGMPYQMHGPEAWKQNMSIMRAAFPDAKAHIDEIFGAEDRVFVRLTMRATHTGEFIGIPATGRAVEYISFEHYRLSGNLIAEEWICSDMLTLMRQLGAVAA
jgi:steroid delta-isomerase-like uncharacterized protein